MNSLIGTLVKHKHISIANSSSLRIAVELMAKENIDVLPVLSKENENVIIGVLSYHDIISAYKYNIDEHERQRPNISIKEGSLKIFLRGKKLITTIRKH
jgi:CBS domain-containing protein